MSGHSHTPDDAVSLVQRLTELMYQDATPAAVPDDVHGVLVNLLVAVEAQRNCIESLRDTVEELRARATSAEALQCDCGMHV